MHKYWQQYAEWFDARNERERVLIILVCLVAIISLWLVLISDPQTRQRDQLKVQLASTEQQKKAIQAQITAIIERSRKDPNRVHQAKIDSLLKNIEVTNADLQKKMRGFIDPSRMASVLEDVLKQDTDLQLVSLESLPPEFIFAETEQKQQKKPQAGLYRHGFKMELHGSYLHTLDYLKALEALPWDFYWDAIEVEVVKYPQAKIVIQLHTLSLKEGWIGV